MPEDLLETLARHRPTTASMEAAWTQVRAAVHPVPVPEEVAEHPGELETDGRPGRPGPPETADRPGPAGLPATAGRPEPAGLPATAGRPGPAGLPETAARPESAGPHDIAGAPRPVRGPRGWRLAAPLLASAAVVALAVGVAQYLVVDDSRTQAGSASPTAVVQPGQYDYSVRTEYVYSGDPTRPILQRRTETWMSRNGATHTRAVSDGVITCAVTPAPRRPGILASSARFLAHLPTDSAALDRYLRAASAGRYLQNHLAAAPDIDAMVFDEPGLLLDPGNRLATPALRRALLRVLERTPGATVHPRARDLAGQIAIRIDTPTRWKGVAYRRSVYVERGSARYLGGELVAAHGRPREGDNARVIGRERIVDHLPASLGSCPRS